MVTFVILLSLVILGVAAVVGARGQYGLGRSDDCPEAIVDLARRSGLGPVERRFRQHPLVEYLFVVAAVGAGILMPPGVPGGLVEVALVVAVGWTLARIRRRYGQAVYVCADGLLVAGRTGDPIPVAWSAVAALRTWTDRLVDDDGGGLVERVTLTLTDGRVIGLNTGIWQDPELTDLIVERVSHALLPEAVARFVEGRRIDFGPLVVSRTGIYDGALLVRWSDITRLTVSRRRLRVYTGGVTPVISRRVRAIPNLALLLTLAARKVAARLQVPERLRLGG
jgi:hypothetical protein